MYNRYGESVGNCVPVVCLTYALFFSDIVSVWFYVAGSEAMYADLGHFSQLSIKVHR